MLPPISPAAVPDQASADTKHSRPGAVPARTPAAVASQAPLRAQVREAPPGVPSFLGCCRPRSAAVHPAPPQVPPPGAIYVPVSPPTAATASAASAATALGAREVSLAPLPEAGVQRALRNLLDPGRYEEAADLFIRETTGPHATPARLANLLRWLVDWERQGLAWSRVSVKDMGIALGVRLRALFANTDQGDRPLSHLVALFDAACREPGFPLPPKFDEDFFVAIPPAIPTAWQKAAQTLWQAPPAQRVTSAEDAKANRSAPRPVVVMPACLEDLLACTGGAVSVAEIGKAWVRANERFLDTESRGRSIRYLQQQAAAGMDGAALRGQAAVLAGTARPGSLMKDRADAETFQPWLDQGFTETDATIRQHLWPALLHGCIWDARSMDRVLDQVLQGPQGARGEDAASAARRQRAACVDLGFAIGSSGSAAATPSLIDRLGAAIRKSPRVAAGDREAVERGLQLGFHAGQHPDDELLSRARVRASAHRDPRGRLIAMYAAHCRGPGAPADFMRGVVRSALPDSEKLQSIRAFMRAAGSRLGPDDLRLAREALVEALDAAGPYEHALKAFYEGYAQGLSLPLTRLAGVRSLPQGAPDRAIALGVLGSHLAWHAEGVTQELRWLEGITQSLRRADLGVAGAEQVLHRTQAAVHAGLGPQADRPEWFPQIPQPGIPRGSAAPAAGPTPPPPGGNPGPAAAPRASVSGPAPARK